MKRTASFGEYDSTRGSTREATPELTEYGYLLHQQGSRPVKTICDSVHGQIPLTPEELQFIDTLQFQRLREIKQLANCYLVFPGAVHTRFEHSIGTSYLARLWTKKLQDYQPELGLDKRDIDCVAIAGLVHDLGHGPFSHLFDGPFMKAIRKQGGSQATDNWSHEDASEMMFDYLIDQNGIDFSNTDRSFVKSLVQGKPVNCAGEDQEKVFLYDIVANKQNSIDVDKFDYFLRDAKNVGIKTDFDYQRLMDNSAVIGNRICFQEKMAFQVYDLYGVRFKLHKTVYKHRVGRAVEAMMVDAMLLAEPYLKFSEAIHSPERFQDLTDHTVLNDICRSKRPELEGARKLIQRMKIRDLYSIVHEFLVTEEQKPIVKENLTREAIAAAGEGSWNLKPGDIFIDEVTTNYAMNKKNPVDSVNFYSRWGAQNSFKIPKEQVSGLLPNTFEETYIKVYSCHKEKMYFVQQALQIVLKRLLPKESRVFRSAMTIPCKESPFIRRGQPPRTPSFSRMAPGSHPGLSTASKRRRSEKDVRSNSLLGRDLFSVKE
ncbi:hypothetical protein SARC_04792 [Sphaeroforma arctica JP610]|uniref:HD/PDEase domain-containing protein n=1 Tax=Sphaeroforma arctica JP610 TaxID=667725 RepID=A0A0L0G1E9_9EUKA|nr:hypothetical protein SARC_04792 [Sphaeroforma arctica JP610]KNC82925.1 hypothetical protein SARC_04792 [Sphaeroforma arctica JP610]|eukprot:XP_014156827.1 hypothetical protein SARC_04792 [Sphaeroforma arctica JP610]